MLHEPAASQHTVDEAAEYKQKLGLKLLAFYGSIYVAFIVVNVVWPEVMGWMVVWGLNVAIVWGMVLIVLAFVMALAYNSACTKHEKTFEHGEQA